MSKSISLFKLLVFELSSDGVSTIGLDSLNGKVLAVMATGAGAMTISHANDSFFWVVTQFSGMDVKTGYRTQTLATLIETEEDPDKIQIFNEMNNKLQDTSGKLSFTQIQIEEDNIREYDDFRVNHPEYDGEYPQSVGQPVASLHCAGLPLETLQGVSGADVKRTSPAKCCVECWPVSA